MFWIKFQVFGILEKYTIEKHIQGATGKPLTLQIMQISLSKW